jgi:imidazolonepropionase-like amidohydrolase
MRSMAAAGLSPQQILDEGTRQVARYFGAEQEFGTVAAGQRADLLLLDANPLSDVANVSRRAGVVVNGRWLPEAEIRARLERIAASYQ